ncbi:MAG TPA: 30S ribosomal protein S6 [Thermomicrobiales bacterium]|nr:30S ribosomal protein S6 [Thermomicrobiales bacterium]
MATQERDPRPYELMTVFVPELSEEDNQAQIDKVGTYIANAGGSLTETLTSSPWGRRRLAYTVRFNGVDYRDGFYTVYHFESAPSNLTELERELKLDTSVMRYLLVHDDPKAGEQFTEDGDESAVGEGSTETAAESQATDATADVEETTETPPATADEITGTSEEAPAEPAAAAAETPATETDETPATDEAPESDDTSEKE